jgi:hypothetical protein
MGEFRDMGIPAQVVKKKSCTSGEATNKIPKISLKKSCTCGFAACAGFFFHHLCRNSHVPKFAHARML